MEPNEECRRRGLRYSSMFQWPNSALIMAFLVLTIVVASDRALLISADAQNPGPSAVADPDIARVARYWGATDQVKIDRHDDKGFYLFGQPVPGGCLYEASNSDDPSSPATAGALAFAPFPCRADSGRAPDENPVSEGIKDEKVGPTPGVHS